MISNASSDFAMDGGNQRFDVTKGVSKCLVAMRVRFDVWYVIRHHHPFVTNLLVDPHRLEHVNITIVDERLLKIQELAFDVPEVHVEDLLALTEVPDYVKNLSPGILQHL